MWTEKIGDVPHRPGVYIFKDVRGKVIYIGKARDLKKRLLSYSRGHDNRLLVPFLVSQIADFEYILTTNETEAFLLEDTLIKKYKPLYNIRLRDDKTYVSIEVSVGDKFPGVYVIRRKPNKKGSVVFGPYSSASSVRETLRYILRVFPLRTCTDNKMRVHRDRPCIYYQIKKCSAPCVGYVDEKKYREYVEGLIRFLKGEGEEIVNDLKNKIEKLAEDLKFEEAAEYRDRLRALERVLTRQAVVMNRKVNADYLGWAAGGGHLVITRIIVRGGRLIDKENFTHSPVINPEEEIGSYIYQLYRVVSNPPQFVYVSPFEGKDVLKELLYHLDVKIGLKSGAREMVNRELLGLAAKNAEDYLKNVAEKEGILRLLEKIKKKFQLRKLPRRIECVDISELGGKEAVGSMVTFIDGEPVKDEYRKYRIKEVEGIDDFGMIREVVTRRLREDRELPDLILIDGGKGQLSVARKVVEDLGLEDEIELLAIAKDRRSGRGERIFKPNRVNPVRLKEGTPEYKLFVSVRNEAHRFAVKYNRLLRKETLKSGLLSIPGIGPRRVKLLWERFSSLKEMAENPARVADILKIPFSKAEKICDNIRHLVEINSSEISS